MSNTYICIGCEENIPHGELCDNEDCDMYLAEPETEDLGGVNDGMGGITSDANTGL